MGNNIAISPPCWVDARNSDKTLSIVGKAGKAEPRVAASLGEPMSGGN